MPKKTKQIRETDPYYCSRRNENMKVGKCLNYFVDANAFEAKQSKCWRCPEGGALRQRYRAW